MSTAASVENDPIEFERIPYPFWPSIVFLVCLGLVVAASMTNRSAEAAPESGIVMTLPAVVGNYLGISEDVSQAEKVILPPDTKFAKKTYSGYRDSINAQIVLAGSEKRSIHRPEYCLPGQGWRIKSSTVVPIKLSDGQTLNVTKLLISRPIPVGNETKELTSCFLYWFVGKNYSTPSHLQRTLRTTWDLVFHHLNHRWAYVIVSAQVLEGFQQDGKNEQQTMEMLEKFISDFAPKIMMEHGAKEPSQN